MKQKQARKCRKHKENLVTRVCLKESCQCLGILCETCVAQHHRPLKACKIDCDEEPLSYFTINRNKGKQMDYFSNTLGSICQIWEKGTEIIQQQMQRLQSTFLFQLNLLCRTFAENSADEIEDSLKYVQQGEDEQSIKMNVNILKCLHKNKQNIENLEQIKVNTEKIYEQVSSSLKFIQSELNKNFKKLNAILDNADIFAVKKKIPQIQEKPVHQSLKLPSLKPLSTKIMDVMPLIQKKDQEKKIDQSEPLIINNENISILQKQDFVLKKKTIIIDDILLPATIIENFLNRTFDVQNIIIESPSLSTQDNLTIVLMCLKKLKTVVLNCSNQIWKCSQALIHYNAQGKQAPLDRIQYFYDFRRDLQRRDIDNFFINKPIIKAHKDGSVKLSNPWSLDRKPLATKATFDLVRRFQLKNMWLAHLNRSQYTFDLEPYDLRHLEELTLGHYGQQSVSMSYTLEEKLKSIQNLRSLTFIKTSHFVLNISNFFKKLNKLQVLIFDEVKFQGDERHVQNFFNTLPKNCPDLVKLSVSHLEKINIDFIANFPKLQTLILAQSKNLIFEANTMLNLSHLNLYQGEWNYIKLLKSLKIQLIKYLNLGCSILSFIEIYNTIHTFCHISSICLDKNVLNANIIDLIDNNKETLANFSISNCKTDLNFKIADILKHCDKIKRLDISKCDIETNTIRNLPPSIEYLVVSDSHLVEPSIMKELTAKNVLVIENN